LCVGGHAAPAHPGEVAEFRVAYFKSIEAMGRLIRQRDEKSPDTIRISANLGADVEVEPRAYGYLHQILPVHSQFTVLHPEAGAHTIRLYIPTPPLVEYYHTRLDPHMEAAVRYAFVVVGCVGKVRIEGELQTGGIDDFETMFAGEGCFIGYCDQVTMVLRVDLRVLGRFGSYGK